MTLLPDRQDRGLGPIDLRAIDRQDCLDLLGRDLVGRVVFTEGALPAVQPVNYILDGEEVVFRTGDGSALAAATKNAVIGFHLDAVDVHEHTGWTILGLGEAYEIVDPVRLARLESVLPAPWESSDDLHAISIPLQVIRGRRLR